MNVKEFLSHGIPVTQVHVKTEQKAKALGRERGLYITMETGPLDKVVFFEDVCGCLVDQLRPLLEPFFGKTLCVCGIGNHGVPSDSLGPETARRFQPSAYKTFTQCCNFEKIAVVCPGVSAMTNLPSDTVISSIASAMGAACVLTIDASACSDIERLCGAIHISSGGMQTYWKTADLRQSALGVPAIAVCVPTAIRMADFVKEKTASPELFLTPVNISEAISVAAFIIACAITQIAYPELDYESCKQYIGLFLNGIA